MYPPPLCNFATFVNIIGTLPLVLCDRQVNMIVENDSSDYVDENH